MDDPHQCAQSHFSALAEQYIHSQVHRSGYSLERLIALLQPLSGALALDVATGGGHVALKLAQNGAKPLASDLTLAMLKAARANLQAHGVAISYAQLEASHLPFRAESLQVITARHAPHHFPDVPRFLSECARVLSADGRLGIVDQIAPEAPAAARYINALERLRDPSHRWQFSLSEWQAMLEAAALEVLHAEIATTRLDLYWWTSLQRNDAETVLRLRVLLHQAPQTVRAFLKPTFHEDGSGNISFDHHCAILIARKAQ
ncbi:MAG: class I SAM-dependent methyltransferase [Candidatus Thermofonsia Clade 1 bacterium]|jgi:ubiquinone/menaquinone biosynthesis C-methylase UbiE|uniref:Class I SAM-dependent methyltransferase n=1 Tax=Candidatus Thermofonsia Clade 1 bacterium TaxID=2364210 RepID=A0A2M8PIM8_9CHLR|nr:MAG: class I SAM-dependent methyltransferase [Candidatus Thermofonsia Clade 1 bacterium]RMF52343.1 MAG: class I SAM-dependent methyltransferase [Chloroflexota bacterium]